MAKGDAFRNTIERRYLVNGKYAKNAASDAERKKLQAMVATCSRSTARSTTSTTC